MVPKQFAEMRDCRIIIGKHLCWKLRQGSVYLGFVQLHGQLLVFSKLLLSASANVASRQLFELQRCDPDPKLRAGATISSSRMACLRTRLWRRPTASVFSLGVLSEGFS
jgi:hypothetical protein